jgi:PLD-like domain
MYSYLKCMNIFKNRPVYDISLKKECCNDPSKFVINSIKNSKNVINIVAYKLNNVQIVSELMNALNRGVKLTMILDYKQNKQNKFVAQLVESGASIKLWKKNEKLHAKFMIIDNEQVLTGSFNLTTLSTFKSHLHKVDLLISLYDANALYAFDTFFKDMLNMLQVDICEECDGNDDKVCNV